MRPRRVELGLLILVWAIGSVCYATVDLATLGTLPVNYLALLLGSGAVLLIGHIVVRRLAPHADPVLFPVAAMLNMLGLVMIHRLDVAAQLRAEVTDEKAPSPDAVAQATWVLVALVLFTLVLFLVTDHRRLQRYTYTRGSPASCSCCCRSCRSLVRASTAPGCGCASARSHSSPRSWPRSR